MVQRIRQPASCQGGGVVGVFVTQGNGEQALPHQGQELMFDLVAFSRVMEAAGAMFSEPIALVQLLEQQAAGIGGYPAAGKIGETSLEKRLSKLSWLLQTVSGLSRRFIVKWGIRLARWFDLQRGYMRLP